MRFWLHVSTWIDRMNERVGIGIYWLSLIMVLIGAYNAIARYFDRFTGWGMSSNMYIELQWYLFSLLFLLGAAYTLKHNSHVRVDVFYGKLSAKGKAWVNVLGTLLFLFPFCILMLIMSIPSVMNSWAVFEMSPDPGGLPRYPIKTMIPIAFILVILQGVSMVIKQVHVLRGNPGNEEGELSNAGDAA
ncbi:MAG: TRAP transporter small permease subunit [Rhodothermaceae bacterium]|nr:TRAP transporter small permease subunit [Rhodothermaceae bacterium]